MFSHCLKLTEIDVSNFNTNKVITMSKMFYNCTSLTSIDLSKFDVTLKNKMDQMFYYCPSLQYIDISSFSNSAKEIDLSDFEAETGILKVKEDFYQKLKIKPSENWTVIIIND